ncbi:hypothetical protein BDZ88DRAFT_406193 [Geranomyces variabilis]|nr:hypothetical protein BDZ88DRAFT_406193 [Geranomyces variabilis]
MRGLVVGWAFTSAATAFPAVAAVCSASNASCNHLSSPPLTSASKSAGSAHEQSDISSTSALSKVILPQASFLRGFLIPL